LFTGKGADKKDKFDGERVQQDRDCRKSDGRTDLAGHPPKPRDQKLCSPLCGYPLEVLDGVGAGVAPKRVLLSVGAAEDVIPEQLDAKDENESYAVSAVILHEVARLLCSSE